MWLGYLSKSEPCQPTVQTVREESDPSHPHSSSAIHIHVSTPHIGESYAWKRNRSMKSWGFESVGWSNWRKILITLKPCQDDQSGGVGRVPGEEVVSGTIPLTVSSSPHTGRNIFTLTNFVFAWRNSAAALPGPLRLRASRVRFCTQWSGVSLLMAKCLTA